MKTIVSAFKHLFFLIALFLLLASTPAVLTSFNVFDKYPWLGIAFPALVFALAFGLAAYWFVKLVAHFFPQVSAKKA